MAKAVTWNNVDMLTPGLKNLGNQFNRRWPNRDGTSDGARGDYAHTQEDSGHNPDDTKYNNAEYDDNDGKPEIRAIDVDNNLNDPEVSFQDVINHMRRLPNLGSVIRYMIFNRKIYRAPNFEPETYTGASAHTEHGHFSGARTQASDENSRFDFKFDELGDSMALTDDDIKRFWDYKITDYASKTDPKAKVSAYDIAAFTNTRRDYLAQTVNDRAKEVLGVLATVASRVDLDPAEIQAIADAIPTAEENAEAVVAALGGVDTEDLATALRSALSADQVAALKAAL
jgi:hypothetical protein